MKKKNSIAIFVAATSALALTTRISPLKAEENDLGGLKEWNTDMSIEADFILDNEAKKLAEESKNTGACIPIGEGENCW